MFYKIVTKTNWTKFINSGNAMCMGFDNDLRDKFVHLSTNDQLYNTYVTKYKNSNFDKTNDYYVVTLQHMMSDDVRWEMAKNGQIYPHLYSGFNKDHVIKVTDMDKFYLFDNQKDIYDLLIKPM